MGFKRTRRTYVLTFPEGDDLHELEIHCRAMTLGELRDMQDEALHAAEVKDLKWQDRELDIFLSYVESWNYQDDDDTPFDVSFKSLRTMEKEDVRRIIQAWYQRCLGNQVSEELGKDSSITQSSVEASIPVTEA